jgi:hypothetical protein
MVVNCFNHSTFYKAMFSLSNPHSFLDYRYDPLPLFYTALSVTYSVLGLLWLTNIVSHSEFSIDLTFTLAMLTAVRGVEMGLKASHWVNRQRSLDTPNLQWHCESIITACYFTLLLAISSLIISGWCIFRATVPLSEVAEILVTSGVTVGAIPLFTKAQSVEGGLIGSVLITFGIIWYCKINLAHFLAFVIMKQETDPNGGFAKRLQIIFWYLVGLAAVLTLVMVGYVCQSAAEVWIISGDVIIEGAFVAFHIAMMWLFCLKSGYTGERDYQVAAPPVRLLAEPDGQEVVLVRSEEKEAAGL